MAEEEAKRESDCNCNCNRTRRERSGIKWGQVGPVIYFTRRGGWTQQQFFVVVVSVFVAPSRQSVFESVSDEHRSNCNDEHER